MEGLGQEAMNRAADAEAQGNLQDARETQEFLRQNPDVQRGVGAMGVEAANLTAGTQGTAGEQTPQGAAERLLQQARELQMAGNLAEAEKMFVAAQNLQAIGAARQEQRRAEQARAEQVARQNQAAIDQELARSQQERQAQQDAAATAERTAEMAQITAEQQRAAEGLREHKGWFDRLKENPAVKKVLAAAVAAALLVGAGSFLFRNGQGNSGQPANLEQYRDNEAERNIDLAVNYEYTGLRSGAATAQLGEELSANITAENDSFNQAGKMTPNSFAASVENEANPLEQQMENTLMNQGQTDFYYKVFFGETNFDKDDANTRRMKVAVEMQRAIQEGKTVEEVTLKAGQVYATTYETNDNVIHTNLQRSVGRDIKVLDIKGMEQYAPQILKQMGVAQEDWGKWKMVGMSEACGAWQPVFVSESGELRMSDGTTITDVENVTPPGTPEQPDKPNPEQPDKPNPEKPDQPDPEKPDEPDPEKPDEPGTQLDAKNSEAIERNMQTHDESTNRVVQMEAGEQTARPETTVNSAEAAVAPTPVNEVAQNASQQVAASENRTQEDAAARAEQSAAQEAANARTEAAREQAERNSTLSDAEAGDWFNNLVGR